MSKKIEIPKEQLEALLFERHMSVLQVAKELDCSVKVVRGQMAKHGIQLSPARKRARSQRLRQLLDKGVKLSPRQRSILTGAILGDGSVCKPSGGGDAYFTFLQRIARQNYVRWMATELEPFTGRVFTREVTGYSLKCLVLKLNTVYHSEFTRLRDMFYPDGKKIVPGDIGEYMNELALAVWFMDDGARGLGCSHLHTQGFTKVENELLCKILENQFGVGAEIKLARKRSGRTLYYLYISKRDNYILHKIIDPLMHRDFEYKKLPKGAVYTGRARGENHPLAKLSDLQIAEIKRLYATGLYTLTKIASEYGMGSSHVSRIVRGEVR